MKIFVIGGTGLVGSYLLPLLVENNNEVYALTRNKDKIEKINKLGAFGILGDIRNPYLFKNNLPENLDVIVLLAMPSVKPGRIMTKKRKAKLREETNDFFRNSMDLAVYYNVPVILPGGTSYKTGKNEIADETRPILRIGLTEIGSDAANAIIKAIEKMPVGEKFIIADDTPVTQEDFTLYMAKLMNKKRPGKIPVFIIKLILGKDFYEITRMNCKVSNEKAKRILGWYPKYPSYKEGLKETIKEIKANNTYQ